MYLDGGRKATFLMPKIRDIASRLIFIASTILMSMIDIATRPGCMNYSIPNLNFRIERIL